MNRRILFSPVGGTDPISLNNYKDGSMLHICRVYQPEEIVLYMSGEILENHKTDNRYIYCLDKLYESLDKKYICRINEREDLQSVQDFNCFYDDFKTILTDIISTMDDSDELLLNVSSGTPAMKSALVVIKTMGEINCKLLQVSTPVKKMNEHTHKGYDVALLWEMNEDNDKDFENRCVEISCPSLSKIRNQEIIKQLLRNYNYSGALEVIKMMPEKDVENYKKLVEIANRRLMVDLNEVNRLSKLEDIEFLPVKDPKYSVFFEYALSLEAKLNNGLYSDFIRGLTPLLVRLFELLIRDNLNINIDDFCYDSHGKRWDEAKLRVNSVTASWIDMWKAFYKERFRFGNVSSSDLIAIIQNDFITIPGMENVVRTASELRKVEESIRNTAAHEISAITPKRIKETTGFTAEEIMKKIKELIKYTNIKANKESWDSYDKMNEYILSKM